MTICSGAPAETFALPYVEGSLPEFEADRFEEHYFECPVCLAHLQALQAVASRLAQEPAPQADRLRQVPQRWPVRLFAAGSIAAMLLIGVFAYRGIIHPPAPSAGTVAPQAAAQPTPQAATNSAPLETAASESATARQIADLALPAFIAPSLRGEGANPRFEAGMARYTRGDCRAATAALSLVPAQAPEARAAWFYTGVCQMHEGNLAAAAKSLHAVANAGDSPQQEAALYYLAQIGLAQNDVASARRYLARTISLHGDFEHRARTENRQTAQLFLKSQPTKEPPVASKTN